MQRKKHVESLALWIGTAGMGIATLFFVAQGLRAPMHDRYHYLVSFGITLVALSSYLAMATGLTHLTLSDGHAIYIARYIDWAITTPLLLLGLRSVVAPQSSKTLLAALLGADVYMIVTGLIGALLSDASKYIWFALSCVAFVAILAILWRPIRSAALASGREQAFAQLGGLLSVLWLIYPILWLLGEEGLRLVPAASETVGFTVLDLLAKVAFGAVSLGFVRRFSQEYPAADEARIVGASRARRDAPSAVR